MSLFNFQSRFVPFVLDGSKTHTIRAERKHESKTGDIAHLYTGLRTKQAKLLFRAPIVRIETIRIIVARVWINGDELDLYEKNLFAWRDGFRKLSGYGSFDLMLEFWAKAHPHSHFDFSGHIIHWDHSKRFTEWSAKR